MPEVVQHNLHQRLAEILNSLMSEYSATGYQLALRSGLSKPTIIRLRKGEVPTSGGVNLATLEKLMTAFPGCTLDFVVRYDGNGSGDGSGDVDVNGNNIGDNEDYGNEATEDID